MPCILEGPGDPMRLAAIRRGETDEELLSHASAHTEIRKAPSTIARRTMLSIRPIAHQKRLTARRLEN
jgi:hypothetical protein